MSAPTFHPLDLSTVLHTRVGSGALPSEAACGGKPVVCMYMYIYIYMHVCVCVCVNK